MRNHEFTHNLTEDEKYFDPGIDKTLTEKGYTFINKGADQRAYLEPNSGLVFKVFGTYKSDSPFRSRLNRSHQSFKDFSDYCRANPNNKFLPKFSGWKAFDYPQNSNNWYLQIRMERLYQFKGSGDIPDWPHELESIARAVGGTMSPESYLNQAFGKFPNLYAQQIILHIGKDGFTQLWRTIRDLKIIARNKGYILDLVYPNFMLRSDGHIVISDPFR